MKTISKSLSKKIVEEYINLSVLEDEITEDTIFP